MALLFGEALLILFDAAPVLFVGALALRGRPALLLFQPLLLVGGALALGLGVGALLFGATVLGLGLPALLLRPALVLLGRALALLRRLLFGRDPREPILFGAALLLDPLLLLPEPLQSLGFRLPPGLLRLRLAPGGLRALLLRLALLPGPDRLLLEAALALLLGLALALFLALQLLELLAHLLLVHRDGLHHLGLGAAASDLGGPVEAEEQQREEGEVDQNRQEPRPDAVEDAPGHHRLGGSPGSVIRPTVGAPACCRRAIARTTVP